MAELYIKGKDGRPQYVGSTADPQLPGRVTELEERMGVIEAAPGGVPLSDAVDSESSTTAATSKAAKTAYDKGVAAATAASAAQSAATAAKTAADTAQDTADAAKTAAAAAQTKANSAYTEATKAASTSAAGRVQLSDAVNSAVSTTAATSKAAKTAYDKGVAAATAASAAQSAATAAKSAADTAQSTATAAKSAAAAAQTKANSAYTLAEAASFPKGTRLLFHQAAAPTGWTKQTTVNDAALRVVSGTTGGGTGGSLAFSSLFAAGKAVTLSGSVGATTLTLAQLASHTHPISGFPSLGPGSNKLAMSIGGGAFDAGSSSPKVTAAGGSQSHTHTLAGSAKIALNVKYTDVIICAKA